jgi:hypothetical protein
MIPAATSVARGVNRSASAPVGISSTTAVADQMRNRSEIWEVASPESENTRAYTA